jgi:hypothetical protein
MLSAVINLTLTDHVAEMMIIIIELEEAAFFLSIKQKCLISIDGSMLYIHTRVREITIEPLEAVMFSYFNTKRFKGKGNL